MFFKSYVSLFGKVSGDYANKSCKVTKDKNHKYFFRSKFVLILTTLSFFLTFNNIFCQC